MLPILQSVCGLYGCLIESYLAAANIAAITRCDAYDGLVEAKREGQFINSIRVSQNIPPHAQGIFDEVLT